MRSRREEKKVSRRLTKAPILFQREGQALVPAVDVLTRVDLLVGREHLGEEEEEEEAWEGLTIRLGFRNFKMILICCAGSGGGVADADDVEDGG